MNLKEKPFYLNEEDIQWVEETLASMTVEEKVGQLFCPTGYSRDPEYLLNEILRWHVGGIFFRVAETEEKKKTLEFVQRHSKVPLLLPANLEAGGDGAVSEGTPFGKQMAVAATNDKKQAYRLGKISCSEAAEIGVNWSFAPVVDIDMNFHNPITNVRTYGSDPNTVITYAKEYIRAAKECNVATSIKHFPGDGVDERDQHILTAVNSLAMEEWDSTFGRVYQELIEAGSLAVMVGHIALPAYQEYYGENIKKEPIPATLSKALLNNLLREKLNFNGVTITDSSLMIGFTSALDRATAVPLSIECGCDMFLFVKDMKEDFNFMLEGYRKGILSEERLLEANKRILAMKAALGLHKPMKEKEKSVIRCEEHIAWSCELADQSITLVKDTQKLLPISPQKTKRILLEVLGPFQESCSRVQMKVKAELEKKGFEVILYKKEESDEELDNIKSIREKYDLVLYIGNVENASNQTTSRLNWYMYNGQGNNVPWFVKEVPTMFISVANPYHLLDAPMIRTFINCYSNNDYVLEAVVEKITGNSEFKGVSPVDPFCGRRELRY